MVYVQIGSSSLNGPILKEIDERTFFNLVRSGLSAFYGLVNDALKAAEASVPEGTRIELRLSGLTGGPKKPSELATLINYEYARGNIRDPNTGEVIRYWPENRDVIAVAWDDAAGTLVLRWLKGIAWVWVIIALIVIGFAIYGVYTMLRRAGWWAATATPVADGGGGGGGITIPAPKIWGLSIWTWAAIVAAFAVSPWVLRKTADFIRARRELERAEKGLPPLE